MIPNQWYIILSSDEVRKNKVLGVRRMGENLVVWRNPEGKVALFRDRCPHRGIKLSKGKVNGDHLQCPFHGFEYDLSGRCRLIPANGKAASVPDHIRAEALPVIEKHGFIYIWYSLVAPTDNRVAPAPEVPWFTDLDQGDPAGRPDLLWKGFTDHWKAHYSRAIENQLDVVHVPFIHHTTIGRGIGPVVNGPYVESDGQRISFWPSNEHDTGQTPIPPSRMTKPANKSTYITFLFPNLWQNHIMESMRIVVAFVPVDENNTIFYLRTYQKMVKIPILRDLYFFITKIFNVIVLHQDRRVVETHQPQASQLKMDENLISGDYPIILYRRKRDELKNL